VGHIPIRPEDGQAAPRNLLRYCAYTRGMCSDIANVGHLSGLLQLPAASEPNGVEKQESADQSDQKRPGLLHKI
jgi:hypothetical protein